MNRREFVRSVAMTGVPAVAGASFAVAAVDAEKLGADHDDNERLKGSARRIQQATAAAMAMQRRDWEQGILAQAMLEAGERESVILLTKAAMVQLRQSC